MHLDWRFGVTTGYIELLLHGIRAHRFALDQHGVVRIEELAI